MSRPPRRHTTTWLPVLGAYAVLIAPLSARRLLSLLVLSTLMALVTGAAALLGRHYDVDLGLVVLLGVTVGVVLLAFDFGALALALGVRPIRSC